MTSQAKASTPPDDVTVVPTPPRSHRRMPVLLRVEDWEDYFGEWGLWTLDELKTALVRVGSDEGPFLLADLYFMENGYAHDLLSQVIGDVWSGSEYPDAMLDVVIWRRLFQKAGYTVNGQSATRPRQSLVLWRGSVPERRTDWSWTDHLDVALQYASGCYRREPGRVWRANVEPWRLLARNTGREEFEYVIDTEGLDIVEDFNPLDGDLGPGSDLSSPTGD